MVDNAIYSFPDIICAALGGFGLVAFSLPYPLTSREIFFVKNV